MFYFAYYLVSLRFLQLLRCEVPTKKKKTEFSSHHSYNFLEFFFSFRAYFHITTHNHSFFFAFILLFSIFRFCAHLCFSSSSCSSFYLFFLRLFVSSSYFDFNWVPLFHFAIAIGATRIGAVDTQFIFLRFLLFFFLSTLIIFSR